MQLLESGDGGRDCSSFAEIHKVFKLVNIIGHCCGHVSVFLETPIEGGKRRADRDLKYISVKHLLTD